MKRVIAAFFVLLFLAIGQVQANEKHDLIIVTEEWPPYNYTKNGVVTGFSTEVVREIMRRLNIQHKIEVYPGNRGEIMLNRLPKVVNFTLFRTPERENMYQWIGPISQEAMYFYQRSDDNRKVSDLQDIADNYIVTTHLGGLTYSYVVDVGIKNINDIANIKGQVAHLLSGRSDLLVGVSPIGIAHHLKEMGMETGSIKSTGIKLLDFPLYLAVSADMPATIVKQWQDKLDQMKNDGSYDRIYQRYLAGVK